MKRPFTCSIWMTFFFGKVEWVQVAARAHDHGEFDDFSILLNFQSGLQATMKTYAHASWHFPFLERFEVYGMHATYETFEMGENLHHERVGGDPHDHLRFFLGDHA